MRKNIAPISYEYSTFDLEVKTAMWDFFGHNSVSVGSKALDIKANTYRTEADLAYFFEYRQYYQDDSYDSGVVMFDDQSTMIINWPEQHYDNGVSKNALTGRRFKKCVRILKKLKIKMAEEGNPLCDQIPGFLIECLVYNVGNDQFQNDTMTTDIQNCLSAIFTATTRFWP